MAALPEDRTYTMEDIEALPEGQRAELVNGQIYMMTPPKRLHQRISARIHQALLNHIDEENLRCESYAAPFGVWPFADDKTYVEPDISVICDESKLDDDGCKGAPDFVIEIISQSETKDDISRKFRIYHRAGVKEYWTIYSKERQIAKFLFKPELSFGLFSFDEDIPVSICPGEFSINLGKMGF